MGASRGYSYGNRKPTNPRKSKVIYKMLTPEQRTFLELVHPLMAGYVKPNTVGNTTIKVIKKNLRNDNYKEDDKQFLNFARSWYKNYLILKKQGQLIK